MSDKEDGVPENFRPTDDPSGSDEQTAFMSNDEAVPCSQNAKQMETDQAIAALEAEMSGSQLAVLADRSLVSMNGPQAAATPDEIDAYLDKMEADPQALMDETQMKAEAVGAAISTAAVKRAFRAILRKHSARRRRRLLKTLLKRKLSAEEAENAFAQWTRLGEQAFERDPPLTTAGLQHFVWQIKRKALNLPVEHHAMIVVHSRMQGCGKTEFVKRFVTPLEELASDTIPLAEFADPRAGDIYNYLAVVVDDLGPLDPNLIANLKSLITGTHHRRRRLGTSMSVRYRQNATLIGTSNLPVVETIPDRTGHRRFLEIDFKNGNTKLGGDPNVWLTVNQLDYGLMWAAVDPYGPPPIAPFLSTLVPPEPLLVWLRQLDISSHRVLQITERDGVQASKLLALFTEDTDITMTISQFGLDMTRYTLDPAVPFGTKRKVQRGIFYPLKPRT